MALETQTHVAILCFCPIYFMRSLPSVLVLFLGERAGNGGSEREGGDKRKTRGDYLLLQHINTHHCTYSSKCATRQTPWISLNFSVVCSLAHRQWCSLFRLRPENNDNDLRVAEKERR